MLEWVHAHRALVWTLATGLSLLLLAGSLVVIPTVLARIPADHFVRPPRGRGGGGAPGRRLAGRVLKNLLALLLVAAGLVMLVTPGQGLLSIAAGLLLLDYPGKRRVELWLVCRRPVRRAVGAIRRRRGRPPLQLPGPGQGPREGAAGRNPRGNRSQL